jgi:hypothetical protein
MIGVYAPAIKLLKPEAVLKKLSAEGCPVKSSSSFTQDVIENRKKNRITIGMNFIVRINYIFKE